MPLSAVRVSPSRVVPEIEGVVWLTGGAAATLAVWVDVAAVDPAAFVAVTTTRIVDPASVGPSA